MALVFTSRKILRLAALSRYFSEPVPNNCQSRVPYVLFDEKFKNEELKEKFLNDMVIREDYITPEEEESLLKEVEPVVKRLRYETNHWDDAITKYRETEKPNWNESNRGIIERIKKLAFKPGDRPLKSVHVLDLKADGFIKPHVDSVKYCGSTIAGISLLTDSVMRMKHCQENTCFVDVLLKRRSLYIMTGVARYDFTHEILPNGNVRFGDTDVVKTRRISIICRNEP